MPYSIEVKITNGYDPTTGAPRYRWAAVRPTGGLPYRWETRTEAEDMRRICYPETDSAGVRIVEVPTP